MKPFFPHQPLRLVAPLSLAAFLCAGSAFAQNPPVYNFQISNNTLSGGDPVESVTDDLTFNNLLLTETYSDGISTKFTLGSLDTATLFLESPAALSDATGGVLSTVVLSGTLGRDGFPLTLVLDVTLQQSLGGPTFDQYIGSAFSTTLSLTPFSTAPAGSISVGQLSLLGNGSPLFGAAPTEILVAPAVPEASTTVSLGLMLMLGLGGLMVSRRRAAAK